MIRHAVPLPSQSQAHDLDERLPSRIPFALVATGLLGCVTSIGWGATLFIHPEILSALLPGLPVIVASVLIPVLTGVFVFLFVALVRFIFWHTHISLSVIKRLQETRDRYAETLEGSGSGTWERTFPDGAVTVSNHWAALFGYDKDTAPKTADAWAALVHDEDKAAVERMLAHTMGGNMRFYKMSYRLRTRGGDWRFVTDEGVVERNPKKPESIRIVGATRDMSAMHDAEELLKHRTEELRQVGERLTEEMRNTRKFEQAVAAAGDAIVITNPDGIIVYANAAWETLTGVALARTMGRSFLAPFEETSIQSDILDVRQAIHGNVSYTIDRLIGTRSGNTPYNTELALFPIIENNKTLFYIAIFTDVTKRKAVDKAKTEFVSLASHQLRTPLSTVRWYAEMLLTDMAGSLSKDQHAYVQEIYDANKRMIELVDALLNVSRLDLGTMQWRPEPLRMSQTVLTAIKEIRPMVDKKHIDIATVFSPDEKDILFDRGQLHIIFQNLLSNAMKYTQEGGHIEVTVRPEGEDRVFFSVRDNGYGIPKEQQSSIFRKMFRADNAKTVDTSGTGLGLYIIKNIVEHVGGSIRFESELGKGTVFYGILPLRAELTQEQEGKVLPGPVPSKDTLHTYANNTSA